MVRQRFGGRAFRCPWLDRTAKLVRGMGGALCTHYLKSLVGTQIDVTLMPFDKFRSSDNLSGLDDPDRLRVLAS